MSEVFIARQPIYDAKLSVHGYELLYRRGTIGGARVKDGETATSQLVLNAITEFGMRDIVGNCPAFINVTKNFMLDDAVLGLDPKQVVLEILEDVTVDDVLFESVKKLSARGFKIALDDFVYSSEYDPLLRLIDYVKLDFLELGEEKMKEHVRQLMPFDVQILAEKVETESQFKKAFEMGCDLFQGYFLSEPTVMKKGRLPSNRLASLELLSKLESQANARDLEEVISKDVGLSYKMMRMLNSAAYQLPQKVASIRQGVVLLGRRKIKSLASLLVLSKFDDKPKSLLITAMIRAKMCEGLGAMIGLPNNDQLFTIGLFSALDSITSVPLPDVISALPLEDETVAALLLHEGDGGKLLSSVLHYEKGDFSEMKAYKLNSRKVRNLYFDSVKWAEEVGSSMSE